MSAQSPTWRKRLIEIALVALILALFASTFVADHYYYVAAKPPEDMKTLDDFRAWKRGSILAHGVFIVDETKYTVMLAPAGRCLESGPSAYLFDEQGRFVEWTSDMGDFSTNRHSYMLNKGAVDFEWTRQ